MSAAPAAATDATAPTSSPGRGQVGTAKPAHNQQQLDDDQPGREAAATAIRRDQETDRQDRGHDGDGRLAQLSADRLAHRRHPRNGRLIGCAAGKGRQHFNRAAVGQRDCRGITPAHRRPVDDEGALREDVRQPRAMAVASGRERLLERGRDVRLFGRAGCFARGGPVADHADRYARGRGGNAVVTGVHVAETRSKCANSYPYLSRRAGNGFKQLLDHSV